MLLKKHETPRKGGRNTKSKAKSARLRQMKKARQFLRRKLKDGTGF